jgi:predicted MFS family arabinose efflux permease
MNRVRTGERGSATGSFTAAFDLAFAGGQILLGVVLEATSFGTVFIIGGISAFLGGVFYILGKARSDQKFPELSHPR